MLNRKKFLYISFVFYLFVIFIPVNLMMYFPSILPFQITFLVENETVFEENNDLLTSDMGDIVKESTMPVLMDEPSAFGNLVGSTGISASSKVVKPKQALFNNCLDENCSSFNITNSEGVSSKITTSSYTVFFCVNKRINGTDMTRYTINFNIEDDLYSSISQSNVSTVLSLYENNEPIQYESIGDIVTWVSIYLDNCNDIK